MGHRADSEAYRFREKLLPFMPVLRAEDFADVDHLIETKPPLAHCVCYVTAKFLPGGKEIRDILLPKVVQFLRGKVLDEISSLSALIALYAYADFPSPSSHSSEVSGLGSTLFWPVKSLVEMYALRFSLHTSIQGLRSELRSETPIGDAISYRKYTFWLQLFVMAH